jgi:hypothetical protein
LSSLLSSGALFPHSFEIGPATVLAFIYAVRRGAQTRLRRWAYARHHRRLRQADATVEAGSEVMNMAASRTGPLRVSRELLDNPAAKCPDIPRPVEALRDSRSRSLDADRPVAAPRGAVVARFDQR